MARRKMVLGPLAQSIFDGEHDDQLAEILAAAQARQKNRFRKGQRVRIDGTGQATINGAEGVILKTNTKTISVGVGDLSYEDWDAAREFPNYSLGSWNLSSNFLTVV